MKKRFKNFLLLALIVGVGAVSVGLFANYGPSDTLEDLEIPLYDLANHGVHTFEAVNDQIQLQATVLPADADDPTVVWTTSDATAVNILSTSAAANVSTATIKCLKNFGGSTVTITARATNGTVTETDDFVATCVCCYYVAVESIDLQLWTITRNAGQDAIASYDSQITNFVDLPISFTVYYAFKVIVSPSNASLLDFSPAASYNGSGDLSSFLFDDALDGAKIFAPNDQMRFLFPFRFYAGTIPNESVTFSVISDDNSSITDSITISVGNHLGTGDLAGTAVAFSPTNVTYTTFGNIASWETAVNDYSTTKDVGSYVRITLPDLGDVVQGAYTVSAPSAYFTIVDDGDNDLSGGATIIIQLTGATGATSQSVSIIPTNYTSQTLYIPFLSANPKVNVTGISLDNTTVTF